MKLTLQNIIPIINAKWFGNDDTAVINSISIDSRSLQNDKNTLFFALSGPNHDGHVYIKELINKGVQHFVVNQIPEGLADEATFLLVDKTLEALQKFAAFYRSQFDFPIIGITGSNGKTIIKEWLNFLLSPDYNIIRSPKSYNSQVGVPLSILGINEKHNLGIFEAGISTMHEMEKLQKIIRPTIGILSNIGSAHDEGFPSVAEKIKEKLKLFATVNVLILQKNKTIIAWHNYFDQDFKPTTITEKWQTTTDNLATTMVRFRWDDFLFTQKTKAGKSYLVNQFNENVLPNVYDSIYVTNTFIVASNIDFSGIINF